MKFTWLHVNKLYGPIVSDVDHVKTHIYNAIKIYYIIDDKLSGTRSKQSWKSTLKIHSPVFAEQYDNDCYQYKILFTLNFIPFKRAKNGFQFVQGLEDIEIK